MDLLNAKHFTGRIIQVVQLPLLICAPEPPSAPHVVGPLVVTVVHAPGTPTLCLHLRTTLPPIRSPGSVGRHLQSQSCTGGCVCVPLTTPYYLRYFYFSNLYNAPLQVFTLVYLFCSFIVSCGLFIINSEWSTLDLGLPTVMDQLSMKFWSTLPVIGDLRS